jgi:hypothetical protein
MKQMIGNGEDLMILITIGSGFVALVCLLMCLALAIKLRSVNKRAVALSSGLEEELTVLKQNLEATLKRGADQARRVAWLESRVRPGAPAPRQERDEDLAAVSAEPSITERRHRVLSLARRGLDVNTIAATLGEMPGEVELIIGLMKAA